MINPNLIERIKTIFKTDLWNSFDLEIPVALKLRNGEIIYILFIKSDMTIEFSIFYGQDAPYYLGKSLRATDSDDLNFMRVRDAIISLKSLNVICFLDPEISSNFVDISQNEMLIDHHIMIVSQDLFASRINQLNKYETEILEQCLDLFESLQETLYTYPDFIEKQSCFLNGKGIINQFEEKDGFFIHNKMALPVQLTKEEIKPVLVNDLQKARLKRMNRIGTLQVDLISSGERILEEDGFSIPLIAFIVEENTGFAFPFITEKNYRDEPNAFLSDFVDRLIELEFYPKKIQVLNDRTYAFLEDFCHRLNIELERVDFLYELEEAEVNYSQFQNLSDEDFEEQIDQTISDSDEVFHDILDNLFEEIDLGFEDEDNLNSSYFESEKEFINIIKNIHGHPESKKINDNKKIIKFEDFKKKKDD